MTDPTQLWEAIKAQLQTLIPDQQSYNANILPSRLLSADNGAYVIETPESRKEWLEKKLYKTLVQAIAAVVQQPPETIRLEFVISANGHVLPPAEADNLDWTSIPAEILDFDPFRQGGYFAQSNYIQQFWGAYLGAPAMQLINYVRSFYRVERYIYSPKAKGYVPNPDWQPWTTARRFQASELARALKVSRQRVTGMERTCHRYDAAYKAGKVWAECQPGPLCGLHAGQIVEARPSRAYPEGRPVCRYWWSGLFDMLEIEEGLLRAEKKGDVEKIATVYYDVQVFQAPPLLTPWQVSTLPEPLQEAHRDYLLNPKHGLSLALWEAITVKRLMPALTHYLWSGSKTL